MIDEDATSLDRAATWKNDGAALPRNPIKPRANRGDRERERDSILELGLEQLFSPDPGNWIVQLTDSRLVRVFILIFFVFFFFFSSRWIQKFRKHTFTPFGKSLTNKWKRISSFRMREEREKGWKGKRTARNGGGVAARLEGNSLDNLAWRFASRGQSIQLI